MLRPLRDRIVVKPLTRKLSDVIYIENKEKHNEGTVVAIGPKVRETEVGDVVKYGNGTYLDWPIIEEDGEEFQIIQEADICFIMIK
jgi:co-chaperonin GroES (HSP10)